MPSVALAPLLTCASEHLLRGLLRYLGVPMLMSMEQLCSIY